VSWGKGNSWQGRGVSSSRGVGAAEDKHGDRNWSSLGRQKDKRGLLVIIHILCETVRGGRSVITIVRFIRIKLNYLNLKSE
jgi:hypothetical protein